MCESTVQLPAYVFTKVVEVPLKQDVKNTYNGTKETYAFPPWWQ